MKKFANLTYGDASRVADHLNSTSAPTHGDLLAALINALNRISQLEGRVKDLEQALSIKRGVPEP